MPVSPFERVLGLPELRRSVQGYGGRVRNICVGSPFRRYETNYGWTPHFSGGGALWFGGDSSAVHTHLRGVRSVKSTGRFAFAAIKSDGSVVTWGNPDPEHGGDSSAVAEQLRGGVQSISATASAFAAIKSDGSVVTWGDAKSGGDSSAVAEQLRGGVESISATASAFAAIKSAGSVVTWGYAKPGGDSSAVAEQLRGGVESISATSSVFAAIKADGSVVTWGIGGGGPYNPIWGPYPFYQFPDYYYSNYSTFIRDQLSSGVQSISATYDGAFAALKSDGSVVTWGEKDSGGNTPRPRLQGVRSISATHSAFAAIKEDGSVVVWGKPNYGGSLVDEEAAVVVQRRRVQDHLWHPPESGPAACGVREHRESIAERLRGGVRSISATESAFAAIKSDGSVVTWGDPRGGGDSGPVQDQLRGGVRSISGAGWAFAALKEDGSVVTWGNLSSGVEVELPEELQHPIISLSWIKNWNQECMNKVV